MEGSVITRAMHGRRLPRLLLANLFYMGTSVKKPVTIAEAEKVPAENLDEDKSDAKMDNAGEPAGAKRTVSTPEKSPPAKRVAGEPKPLTI